MSARILPENVKTCSFICECCGELVNMEGHHGRCPHCNSEYWIEVSIFNRSNVSGPFITKHEE